MNPQKIFLTGASSGIGQALARAYAAQGATLGPTVLVYGNLSFEQLLVGVTRVRFADDLRILPPPGDFTGAWKQNLVGLKQNKENAEWFSGTFDADGFRQYEDLPAQKTQTRAKRGKIPREEKVSPPNKKKQVRQERLQTAGRSGQTSPVLGLADLVLDTSPCAAAWPEFAFDPFLQENEHLIPRVGVVHEAGRQTNTAEILHELCPQAVPFPDGLQAAEVAGLIQGIQQEAAKQGAQPVAAEPAAE